MRLLYPEIVCFAIPNGGRRGKTEAAIMKSEGVLAGVADLFIMKPSGGYSGLFVELKSETGRQSPAQKEFELKCRKFGYSYCVCRSLDEFIVLIRQYL